MSITSIHNKQKKFALVEYSNDESDSYISATKRYHLGDDVVVIQSGWGNVDDAYIEISVSDALELVNAISELLKVKVS